MLSAGAYSFRQKSRLAISLSWIAGYVNVVALLVGTHAVSHTTGNMTTFAQRLAQGQWDDALFLLLVVTAFTIGAVISSATMEATRRHGAASNYALPVAIETLLLIAFAWTIRNHRLAGPSPEHGDMAYLAMFCFGSMAMGMQNATITKISGAVVRTTHLTGVFTDLGIDLVHFHYWLKDRLRTFSRLRLRRLAKLAIHQPTVLRIALLSTIIGSFMFGAVAGAWCYLRFPEWAMALPVSFLLWIIFIDWYRPIAAVRELDMASDPELRMAGIASGMLPPEIGIYRLFPLKASVRHRAPNFQRWVTAVPRQWQVVILALSPLTHLDTNAALDLRAAIEYLHARRRKLVICGLTQQQYQVLAHAGIDLLIGHENLCPDMEFAIARALAEFEDMGHHRPAGAHSPRRPL